MIFVSSRRRRNEIRSHQPRWQPNHRVTQLAALERATFPRSRRSPPVVSVRSTRAGSCWRRRCSQPRDEPQDIVKHLPHRVRLSAIPPSWCAWVRYRTLHSKGEVEGKSSTRRGSGDLRLLAPGTLIAVLGQGGSSRGGRVSRRRL